MASEYDPIYAVVINVNGGSISSMINVEYTSVLREAFGE